MKVIVDGDAVFIAADDFVDLQVSDVTWVDVPESELRDYQRRDLQVATHQEIERDQGDEARRLLVKALAAYRSALITGHSENDELRALSHTAFEASKNVPRVSDTKARIEGRS